MVITVRDIQYSLEFEYESISPVKKSPPICRIQLHRLPEEVKAPPFILLTGRAEFHDKGKPDFVEARKAAFTKAIKPLPVDLRRELWDIYKSKFRYINRFRINTRKVSKGTSQSLCYIQDKLTYKVYFKRELQSVKTLCVIDAFNDSSTKLNSCKNQAELDHHNKDNEVVAHYTGVSICKVNKGDVFNAVEGRQRAFERALHKAFPLNNTFTYHQKIKAINNREHFWELYHNTTRSYKKSNI